MPDFDNLLGKYKHMLYETRDEMKAKQNIVDGQSYFNGFCDGKTCILAVVIKDLILLRKEVENL